MMKTLVSGVAALSCAAFTFAVAGPAFADDPAPAAPAAAVDLGNINQTQTGSLVIHKYESGSLTTEGKPSGTPAPTGGTPVPGVKFTAYKLTDLDPTKQKDWKIASAIQVPADACGANWTTPALTRGGDNGNQAATFAAGVESPATATNGEATIANLAVGFYLVCETEVPASVQKRAMPFLVTLPTPNGADGWLYNVNVYPKNLVIKSPKKQISVTDLGLKTDNQISYPVTVTVPSIAENEQFSYFVIDDTFVTGNEPSADAPTVEIKEAGQQNFTTVAADKYTVTNKNLRRTVSFTRAGLTDLKSKANAEVRVTFKAKADQVTANGEVSNSANFYVDTEAKADAPAEPTVDIDNLPQDAPEGHVTNVVKSSWGNLTITKQDADNQKPLQGASFEIYNATEATRYATTCENAVAEGDAISVDGATTFTTGNEGTVGIAGLFVDSKEFPEGDKALTLDHTQRCYVLKETAAPAGYVTPKDPFTPVTIKAGTATDDNATVTNTKVPLVDMPMTGANGRLLMIVGGSALALTALGTAFILARKRS